MYWFPVSVYPLQGFVYSFIASGVYYLFSYKSNFSSTFIFISLFEISLTCEGQYCKCSLLCCTAGRGKVYSDILTSRKQR